MGVGSRRGAESQREHFRIRRRPLRWPDGRTRKDTKARFAGHESEEGCSTTESTERFRVRRRRLSCLFVLAPQGKQRLQCLSVSAEGGSRVFSGKDQRRVGAACGGAAVSSKPPYHAPKHPGWHGAACSCETRPGRRSGSGSLAVRSFINACRAARRARVQILVKHLSRSHAAAE